MRYLEDIVARNYKGERLTYGRMLLEAIDLLRDLKFELGNYFEPLMLSVLHYMEMILDDRYLLRRYINCPDDKLSRGGVEIRKNYRRLVSLRDEFESVRKSLPKARCRKGNRLFGEQGRFSKGSVYFFAGAFDNRLRRCEFPRAAISVPDMRIADFF